MTVKFSVSTWAFTPYFLKCLLTVAFKTRWLHLRHLGRQDTNINPYMMLCLLIIYNLKKKPVQIGEELLPVFNIRL